MRWVQNLPLYPSPLPLNLSPLPLYPFLPPYPFPITALAGTSLRRGWFRCRPWLVESRRRFPRGHHISIRHTQADDHTHLGQGSWTTPVPVRFHRIFSTVVIGLQPLFHSRNPLTRIVRRSAH